VLQVGHGAVRIAVMGFEDRPATPAELTAMERLVAQAMEQGAVGLSSGLAYAPGCYAPESELVALAKVVARYGGFYSSHIRNEGDRLEEAVAEALTVGREAALPVQLSHHKAAGRANWGKVHRTLALMDEARSRGEDVAADQYPYTASATTMTSQMPDWALVGGVDAMVARLRDPATREQIRARLRQGDQERWARVHIASVAVEDHRSTEGRSVAEVAGTWGVEAAEAVCQLLEANFGQVGQVSFSMDEADVRTVMRHPAVAIGSDGLAFAPRGGGKPHPRYYGTFPRVLGHYRRDEGIFSLEEAVRKMTSLPASRVRLWDRGILRPGAAADVVLFDPDTVADGATFSDPHRYPIGIDLVIVGGQIVVEDGLDTGATAGRLLRQGEGAGVR
jgi:N-acyl-D-amino-acid deacylase